MSSERLDPARAVPRSAALRKKSAESVIGALLAGEFASFQGDCVAAASKEAVPSQVLWWLAECSRLKADYRASQAVLVRYLTALRAQTPTETRKSVLENVVRQLQRRRYRAEAIMAGMRSAAVEDTGGEKPALDRMVTKSRLGVMKRITDRWLSRNPLPSAEAEKEL